MLSPTRLPRDRSRGGRATGQEASPMTSSAPAPDDDAGLEQEAIWDDAADDAETSRATPPGRGRRGLTRSITAPPRVPGPDGLTYADVPNRVIAMVIDLILLSLTGFVLALLFGGLVTAPGALDSAGGQLDVVSFLLVLLLQLAISFGYFAYCWVVLRGTLGMKLLGLRIGDEVGGGPLEWRQAALRWVLLGIPSLLGTLGAYVPSIVGVILSVLGLAWLVLLLYSIAQSPTKQGLHDRYAHSILVKARRRAG
jgi:uncharacterized RDD family membrane protein YckC